MKRITFLLLVLSFACSLPISARWTITPHEAQVTAIDLIDELNGPGTAHFSNVVITQVSQTDGITPVLYVVNTYNRNFTKGHFVILETISGTTLAYGDGLLDEDSIPDAMQLLLDYYTEQIDYLLANNSAMNRNTSPSFPSSQNVVAPLLSTKWGQRLPYNLKCPLASNGNRCPTGCGATAMAQVMKKWEYPQGMVNAIPGYTITDTSGNIVVEVDDLPSIQFDWGNMLDSYTDDHTAAQDSAVATLMRYVGQAQGTMYGTNESGSTPNKIKNALNNLGYTASCWVRSQTDSLLWNNKMLEELYLGHPIIYYAGAEKPKPEGGSEITFHIFAVDGYDGNGYYHINWGWNGSDHNKKINSNGYFTLDNFTGQDLIWNRNEQMMVDIIPIDSVPPEISVDATKLEFEDEYTGYTQKKTLIVRGNGLKQNIELSISGDNEGVFTIEPTIITPGNVGSVSKMVTVTYTPTWTSGVTSAVLNIESGEEMLAVDLTGKAIQSETIIDVEGGEEIDISFDDGHTGYKQTQTFNVMAQIYYTKDGDETVYSAPLRNNVTLSVDYQGASCPFTVSPRAITPAQASEGIPVTVTYYPKASTEPVSTGKITLSTQGYDITSDPDGHYWPVVNLYGAHNAEPCIRTSESSLAFNNWHTGYEASKTVLVSAYHTTGDIELSLDDSSGFFSVKRTTIPADSADVGVPVEVTYTPQNDGQHSATLTLTNLSDPRVDPVTINLSGNSNSDPCIELNTSSLSFEEYTGYTQTKTFTVNAYHLTNDIILIKRGTGLSGFTVTPVVISITDAEQKEGAIVSVKYSPSVNNNQTNHSAKIRFSSSGENLAELMLNGHSIESDYFVSVDSTSLTFNAAVNQPDSTSITVTIRNDSPDNEDGNGDGNGDVRFNWQGDGEGDDMSGSQLNWIPPSGVLVDYISRINLDPLLFVFKECYAIIEGDDGFEIDAPTLYYKEIEKEVYAICGLPLLAFQHKITKTVPVIFNPKDCKQLTRNARITFYAQDTKPFTIFLTGTVEVNLQQGDVNGDGSVTIADATALIDYLLSGNATGISLKNADCNGSGGVDIADVTALIDYLLSGHW
jgi:hypothetical protein